MLKQSGSGGERPLKRACVGADPGVCPGRTQGFAPTARFHLLSFIRRHTGNFYGANKVNYD